MKESGIVGEAGLLFRTLVMSVFIMAALYFLMHILRNWKGITKGESFKLLFFALLFCGAICGTFIYSMILSGHVTKGLVSLGAAGLHLC